jgi:hypothetical protein
MLGGHDVFHLGRVVEDLDAAMSTIGANLAISWAPVQERTIAVLTAGGEARDEPLRFTYSVDGPPHIELIEAGAGSLWQPTPDGGLHHVGIFAEHVAVAPGPGMELEFGGREGRGVAGFAYYSSPGGIRVELVDARRRASFAAWFAGADLVPARPSPPG